MQAARAVAAGDADAFVSGGSTGAAVAAGLFNIKRAAGIVPARAGRPRPDPRRARSLRGRRRQRRGPIRASRAVRLHGRRAGPDRARHRRRIGLLSNGGEATKGTPLVVEAHALLASRLSGDAGPFAFVGNVEGNDLASGVADVIVTDGFTGNVALKLIEGVLRRPSSAPCARRATSTTRAKAGGLLRPALRDFRDEIDPEGPGGAYLLGLRHLGVVPHGRFTRYGFSQAILLAARGVSGDVVGRTPRRPGRSRRPAQAAPSPGAASGPAATVAPE